MAKRIRVNVNLPFEGFYESRWSGGIDREEEQYCEGRADEDNGSAEDEARHPEALRLTSGELAGLLFRHTDYNAAHLSVARMYVDAFNDVASDELGLPLGLTFEAMTSPRFYNFETDRVFADVDLKVMRELFRQSKAEGHETLRRVVSERFTSRSGFSSFYANDLDDWLRKPLRDWDHNELGTLLVASLERVAAGRDLSWDLYEGVAEGEGFYTAWEGAVDWPAYEKAREEARQEKLDDLAETDPELWRELAGDETALPVVRCPLTLDLFAGQSLS